MLRPLKKLFNFMFSRLFLVALMLAVQIFVLVAGAVYFSWVFMYAYMAFTVLSMVATISVVSNHENPSYKITWIIAILFFPTIGWIFYLLFGNRRMPPKLRHQIDTFLEYTVKHMPDNRLCEQKLWKESEHLARMSEYIYNVAGYPVLQNTSGEYFALGETMFKKMLVELQKAEQYIFLQYFIIRPGVMWDAVFAILKEKVRAGVEVRLIYDDLGSINTLPRGYNRVIRDAGIQLLVFNPFRPHLSVILNHRDHRKLMVIDGKTAFCGGINLADEYINAYDRFGHWKDTGVMLQGDAVWPFTFMFLQQWRFGSDEVVDFDAYHRDQTTLLPNDTQGLVQVFGDTPLDDHNVTEVAYLNTISRAKHYVYITTPYLVIDYEMETALCNAAYSGVDVRIITPYRYDKWYVHTLTRSHYERLLRAGVKVYEYSPGFMHGKMFVADDQVCMVGTCNMDFRSFYLHFECSVLFYASPMVQAVKEDMLACQELSRRVTLEEMVPVSIFLRLKRAILKLFAPLL